MWFGRIRYWMGWTGYPTLRLMTLAETGCLALIGAVIGSAGDREEGTLARRLLPLLQGMLVLLDWAFDATVFSARRRRHGSDVCGPCPRRRCPLPAAAHGRRRRGRVAARAEIRRKTRTKQRRHPKPSTLTGPIPSWMAQMGRPPRNRRMTPAKRTHHASAPSPLTTPFHPRIRP
jgi:hypothetical protein